MLGSGAKGKITNSDFVGHDFFFAFILIFFKYCIRCHSSWWVCLGHALDFCAWDEYVICLSLATSCVNYLLSKYSPRSVAFCLLETSARSYMPLSHWTWKSHHILYSRKSSAGVPGVTQQKWVQLIPMRTWVRSLASLSGFRIWRCHELWYRPQMWLGSQIAVAVV